MLLVLFQHFILHVPGLEQAAGLHQVAEGGRVGLDMFFVLSGFLITGILLDTRGQPHYLRNFYIRRSLRIVPLYYLLLLVFFFVLPPLMFRTPERASLGVMWVEERQNWEWYFGWAANILFFIQNRFAPAGLDVTWSLGIEEQYYLSWALIVLLIGRRWLPQICVFLVLGAIAVRGFLLYHGASWMQIHVITLARMDALSLGGLIAVLMRSPRYDPALYRRVALWIAAAALGVTLALAPFGSIRHDSTVTLFTGYTIVGLFCAGSLVALIHTPDRAIVSRIFRSPFLRFFGKYSYAIYLVHIPIRDEIRRRWFPNIRFQEVDGWELFLLQMLFFAVATGACAVLALLSWNLYEKHWLKLKDYFPKFSRKRPGARTGTEEVLPAH